MHVVGSLLLGGILLAAAPAALHAAELVVEIAPMADNPAHPRMGDRLCFRLTIRNLGPDAASGVVAWLDLLQVDPGKEQPVDLEDWSSQKAMTLPALASGQAIERTWPIRLVQSGLYRIAVIAAPLGKSRGAMAPIASRFADFTVAARPVVESSRVLLVALGVPFVLAAVLFWRIAADRGARSALYGR
jgi:hypothetical protein